jgi:hypothetical protein
MRTLEVPEWGNTKIYYKPVSTLKEQSKLVELASQNKTVEALVESLVMRARNEDGSKMFTITDKVVLMNEVDPGVIIRIVGDMNKNIEEGEEETEAVLVPDPRHRHVPELGAFRPLQGLVGGGIEEVGPQPRQDQQDGYRPEQTFVGWLHGAARKLLGPSRG